MKKAINKCIDHVTSAFSLLEVKTTKPFAIRLSTREDLMKQVLQFCPRKFTYDNVKDQFFHKKKKVKKSKLMKTSIKK